MKTTLIQEQLQQINQWVYTILQLILFSYVHQFSNVELTQYQNEMFPMVSIACVYRFSTNCVSK